MRQNHSNLNGSGAFMCGVTTEELSKMGRLPTSLVESVAEYGTNYIYSRNVVQIMQALQKAYPEKINPKTGNPEKDYTKNDYAKEVLLDKLSEQLIRRKVEIQITEEDEKKKMFKGAREEAIKALNDEKK